MNINSDFRLQYAVMKDILVKSLKLELIWEDKRGECYENDNIIVLFKKINEGQQPLILINADYYAMFDKRSKSLYYEYMAKADMFKILCDIITMDRIADRVLHENEPHDYSYIEEDEFKEVFKAERVLVEREFRLKY